MKSRIETMASKIEEGTRRAGRGRGSSLTLGKKQERKMHS
jgi:hypothetical protein